MFEQFAQRRIRFLLLFFLSALVFVSSRLVYCFAILPNGAEALLSGVDDSNDEYAGNAEP